MKNYLSNRKQFTVINGRKSSNTRVRFGVPQGAVLGPTLFTLFTKDLPLSITSGDTFIYVDGITVFCIDSTQGTACDLLNVALKEIFTWCINKCLTPHPKLGLWARCPPFKLETESIVEHKAKTRPLGVTVDKI